MDELFDTNINRSPAAYLLNPVEERRQYTYDVDKLMTVLGFRTDSGTDLGLISWFAVHGVTVNNTNRLVNGDNKGYASYVTEKHFQKDQDPRFVAAFAQSNEGDVSPHTLGAFCSGTEIPCDGSYANKCPFRSRCIGRGPGWEMGHYETNRIIGQNQATKAIELFRQQRDMPTYVSGVIDFRHQYWDITKATVRTTDGDLVHPCLPAMGYGFAAGTTDGPAVRGLYQNMTKGTLLWGTLAHLLRWPSQQQKLCHAPKPIILNTGEMTYPFEWQPHILDIQLLRIGSVFIIGVPAEFTTMSGRRLRNAVQKTLCEYGICDTVVILSGPANGYSSYVATFEEYQMQRFEGAATAYGPHTLQAYVDAFKTLAKSMALEDPSMIQSEKFRDFTPQAFNFVTRHGADRPKLFHHFGDIVSDVDVQYNRRLNQTVSATFVAGNPRNNVLHEGTFLTVERKTPQGTWSVVRTDNDYDTRFRWRYTSKLFGQSEATIEWDIHEHTEPGTYRLVYYGHNKESLKRTIRPHSGQSSEFTVY
ncbi:Neutral/alkaline nonlysosomal ceramidase [Radiomyces spectabilis]|uniref:Neutral/alkaline nonlysosomal ceramidase n=1 Tax=Radiomyces spectabilis TaxID=64574 RepID=UPI00221E64E2|nr:Neutral/alkaline nonlysosomal ceramidase [Radiomyces spectabilis]KAI8390988.1 Neutral/alkaline nonlysosomal ceramidase [Radiomyces spectabilis]